MSHVPSLAVMTHRYPALLVLQAGSWPLTAQDVKV